MPGITFTVELSEDEARERLASMVERMANPSGFYKSVGEYMRGEAIPRVFARKEAPDGTPWAQLSPVTVKRREARGHTPIQILRSNSTNNSLSGTIRYQVDSEGLTVGSALKKAAALHFGAAQGAFGRTSRGGPIPWGNLPARPYLGLSAEDERQIISICQDWLEVER